MIIAIAEFTLKTSVTREEAMQMFEGSAPKYNNLPGLVQKYYIRAEDGRTVGGVYIWQNRKAADALYNEKWVDFVTQKYGVPPKITFYDNPVSVDNR